MVAQITVENSARALARRMLTLLDPDQSADDKRRKLTNMLVRRAVPERVAVQTARSLLR